MNTLAGYSGLLSLCQAAFFGISAYTTALIMTQHYLPFLFAVLAAIIINLFFSLPIIWFSIKLRDLYFVLATLSWQVIISAVLYNFTFITNGPYGISGIPRPRIFGIVFNTLESFAILGFIFTSVITIFYYFFQKTPLLRILEGVRDDQLAIISFGKKPGYYKTISLLIASGVAAIAGSLYAVYFSYIDPTSFTINESILIASIILIGGLGSIKGSIAGAITYVLLPEILRFINIPDAIAANLRMMIYALILIMIIMFRPQGLFGKYRFQ